MQNVISICQTKSSFDTLSNNGLLEISQHYIVLPVNKMRYLKCFSGLTAYLFLYGKCLKSIGFVVMDYIPIKNGIVVL